MGGQDPSLCKSIEIKFQALRTDIIKPKSLVQAKLLPICTSDLHSSDQGQMCNNCLPFLGGKKGHCCSRTIFKNRPLLATPQV